MTISSSEYRCHVLAQEIEQIHAMDLARVAKLRKSWWQFYDAHAATELGNLIHSRLSAPRACEHVWVDAALGQVCAKCWIHSSQSQNASESK